ncbi:unnamed protein product, partial [Nippostrongylus brasiliensis]|uniref:Rab43 protein (inferred by orthology to a zebrafish protein) n=1 Tax=Nippostrongylus brasiliensis TaxID=27835 RepID=A0A0N4XJT0_NIPBR
FRCFRKISARELDKEGREVASNRGYKYFGAAKDLPGVRELFEESKELEQMRKTRAELMKNVDADYYGYLDDDDGLLIPLEKEEEKRSIEQAEKDSDGEDIDTKESIVVGEDGKQMTIKHVLVPSQSDIEEMIIERKKKELMEKYLQ